MRVRAAAITILLLAPLLAACGNGDGPVASPKACKAKLAENYSKAMANGGKGPTPEPPTACAGLDDKTLQRITGEVISEYLKSDQAKKDFGDAFNKGMQQGLEDMPTPDVSGLGQEFDDLQKELDDLQAEISAAATP